MTERSNTTWMPLWSWYLKNFKSIREAELRFEPLTLLVGPNSAGKSSLIQSILLLVQAAQGEAEGAALPLNGPLASLGTFDDVRFKPAQDRIVTIGGNFVFNDDATPRLPGFDPEDYRPLRQFRRTGPPIATGAVDLRISMDRRSVDEPGSADIASVWAEISMEDQDALTPYTISIHRRGEGPLNEDMERIRVGKLTWPTDQDFSLGYSGSFESSDWQRDIDGVLFRAGIPHNVLVGWELGELAGHVWLESRTRRPIWRGSLGPGPRELPETVTRQREVPGYSEEDMPPEEQKVIQEWAMTAASDIASWNNARQQRPITFPAFLSQQGSVVPPKIRSSLLYNAELLLHRIWEGASAVDDIVYVPPPLETASAIHEPAAEVHRFLSERVVYLGPLREDPRVTYRSTPAGALGYIGIKGEYMASVIHGGRTGEVACPLEDGSLERMRLADALDYWVQRLDLVDSVVTRDLGRLGIQVSVTRGEIGDLDLTSVGVGVSQLLPVVVMCILAPPGSLIMLEQPELHLHPALQQKLGDFLLACSRAGRQLIVETHSEYLVTRLRRRIAEDPTSELVKQVAVIFAEQVDGESRLRRIELNELGGIEDWPVGFFDQAADESKRLVEAGLEKKLGYAGNPHEGREQ